jgi:hypothetical protein
MSELLTIKEASKWASKFLEKDVTTSNISYLIQYGRVPKAGDNGNTLISKEALKKYYKNNGDLKEKEWKKKLGDDLNWALSFSEYKESETTKHVHRLHPYKGKFIPQLVEYFLDDHTDQFKEDVFFKPGDIVLDPFCGSGTTLVQANELGMHAVGIDVSSFNALISNSKISKYDLIEVKKSADRITRELKKFLSDRNNIEFENRLLDELKEFNNQYFPSPEFKRKARNGEINEKKYGKEKEKQFLPIYNKLIEEYDIQLLQENNDGFLDKWYLQVVRDEIEFVFEQLKEVDNPRTKRILGIVLSRTIRSCRATTHSDLGTLKKPQTTTYYCKKHGKICKPLFSILSWWNRYSKDTVKRLSQFDGLRTNTFQRCLTGDSRTVDIIVSLEDKNPELARLVKERKIDGIFSSPPYVGLIDYHEQHAYAYDLFGFERKDELEIGPLYKGKGQEARDSYVEGIAAVLNNCKKYLKEDYDIFLVANDKNNLYPKIAEKAGMKIVNRYKRPVLNRVEKNRSAYAEIIFHLRKNIDE